MPTSRLEAFSDGVFAIAITLLVLDLHPPDTKQPLSTYLLGSWPSFVAYAISVLLIGLVWANHHSMFVHIRRSDRLLLFLNTLLLANVAFLPYPTELLARALQGTIDLYAAAFFYGLTLTVGGFFFNAVWMYASRNTHLMSSGVPERYVRGTARGFVLGPVSYGIATVLALRVPIVALICYAVLIAYYWLPPRGEADILQD